MTIQLSAATPVDEALDGLSEALLDGYAVLDEDQPRDYPGVAGIAAGLRALHTLRRVQAALGELRPEPAMTIYSALCEGLGVTR